MIVHAASATELGQLQASSYSSVSSFSSPVSQPATTFVSSAATAPPVATVMPLHSSGMVSSPQSTQPSEQQTPATAETATALRRASAPSVGSAAYFPVVVHWFYCRNVELRQIWQPFSVLDSTNLESAYQSIISGKTAARSRFPPQVISLSSISCHMDMFLES